MTLKGKSALAAVAAVAAVAAFGVGALTAGMSAAEPRYGAPCTSQDGSPGYYIWEKDKSSYHNNLICNITGDAPRQGPPDPNPFGS